MRHHTHAKRHDVHIDPADLAAAIAKERHELVRTVRELADQYDIPARAQEAAHDLQETAQEIKDATEERAHELKDVAQEGAHELKERATTSDGRPRPAVLAAVAVITAVGVVAYVARKRKQKQEQKESR